MTHRQIPSTDDFEPRASYMTLASAVADERGPRARRKTLVMLARAPAEPELEPRTDTANAVGQARRHHHQSRAAQRQQFARAVRALA